MNAKANYLDMSLGEFFTKSYEILTFGATKGTTDIYLHIISFLSASVSGVQPDADASSTTNHHAAGSGHLLDADFLLCR